MSNLKTPLLALVMMVKDEAESIQNSIRSCSDAVDCVVLVDTGSSDDTVAAARAACDECGSIPLYVYEERFIDFGHTRTTSLQLAAPHATWLLMLSGGETLRNAEHLRSHIEQINDVDALNVEVDFGAITYRHPRITRAGSPWHYKGATHEALVHPKRIAVTQTIPGVQIVHAADKDPQRKVQRWQRDEELLLRDLATNPDDARAQFYYAQTLECLGRNDAAARYYRKRADNQNGYKPEAYEALLRLARLEPQEAIAHLVRAAGMFPTWPDAPTLLAHHYQAQKNHAAVFAWAQSACQTEFSPHTLFSRKHLDQLRWDLLSSSAFYCNKPDIGRLATLQALGMKTSEDQRLRRTFRFYATQERVDGTCVLVTGMGRSGTSLVARLVEKLGVDMGPSIPPDETNPEGFSEDKHVLAMLTEGDLAGVSGYLAARAENTSGLVGCKAPRFADVWDDLLPLLPRFSRLMVIGVVRDVEDAAASYVRCYGGAIEDARKFMSKRRQATLRLTREVQFCIEYEAELLRNPEATTLRLASALGVTDYTLIGPAVALVR